MATNTLAPLGLVFSRNRRNASPTYQGNKYKIKAGYASKIGIGDVVQTGTGGNAGYVILTPDGATPVILGVFGGVLGYFDTVAQQNMNGLNGSWPGAAASASGDIDCLVFDDPDDVFRVQITGSWIQGWRGLNANWVAGTNGAPSASGISTLTLDGTTPAVTAGLPLRIQEVVGFSGGPQDPGNVNPWIEVTFNFAVGETQRALGI
jgi:hypothetical protein